MQTIKVNINTTPSETTFKINGHTVADIHAYSGEHHAEAFCGIVPADQLPESFVMYPDAVEYIGDAIATHFAAFGMNVEFVNA